MEQSLLDVFSISSQIFCTQEDVFPCQEKGIFQGLPTIFSWFTAWHLFLPFN